MTVVGSDNFADAPTLAVGLSSAYTPNAGYSTEVGEPSAWGGKTAWWKVVPTVSEFHYVDVLWSSGLTRAWVYRQTGSGFGGLLLVNDPGAGNQGGWNANAGSTYYIRLDSDGADVSYVASVGMQVYDEIVERYPLTGPHPSAGTDDSIIENYFDGHPIPDSGDEPWRSRAIELTENAVSGSPGTTEFGGYAEMLVGQYVADIIDEYPGYHSGLSWYGDPPDDTYGHPIITFAVTSAGAAETITEPVGYDRAGSRLVVVMSSSAGPALLVDDDDFDVSQIRIDGAFTTQQPVRNVDPTGTGSATDITVPSALTEFTFQMPVGFSDPTTDYNAGTLSVLIIPNFEGTTAEDPQPAPVGTWRISYVALQVLFQSDDPLPYEPPPPPAVLTVVRQYPATSSLAWGGSGRIYPPDKAQRTIGGQQ